MTVSRSDRLKSTASDRQTYLAQQFDRVLECLHAAHQAGDNGLAGIFLDVATSIKARMIKK